MAWVCYMHHLNCMKTIIFCFQIQEFVPNLSLIKRIKKLVLVSIWRRDLALVQLLLYFLYIQLPFLSQMYPKKNRKYKIKNECVSYLSFISNVFLDDYMLLRRRIFLYQCPHFFMVCSYIKDYDGGILMECKIDPKLPYTDLSTMIRRQRQVIINLFAYRDVYNQCLNVFPS